MITKTVEEKIKEIIELRGISQSYVAQRISLNENDLILCMQGKRKFKISEFLNICNVLELDLKDFEETVL